MDSLVGQVVVGGQYRVLRQLGAGGFGTVYEVETVVGQLRRALKVLNQQGSADEQMRERFVNEAVALEQINHPNVARCFAVGEFGEGALYLLLEYIDGVHLRTLLEQSGEGTSLGRLKPRRAMRLAKQIASGLVPAHAQGVLHRDLKLENILITRGGEGDEIVKVIDFGIAKLTDRPKTSTQSLLGTPGFMAPEQLAPGSEIDGRLDLWQLGAVIFMLLTGEAPYTSEHPLALLGVMQQFEEEHGRARRPSDVDPELTRYALLDALVGRLLAVDPETRPSSAREVCRELARAEQVASGSHRRQSSLPLLEALCAEASPRGWWTLCRFLLGHEDELEDLLPAAEKALARWPDALRAAPCSWWEAQVSGEGSPLWPLACSLDLSGQELDDEQIGDLVKVRSLSTLTTLRLADNLVGNDGLVALATSPFLAELRSLDLSGNRVTSASLGELGTGAGLRALTQLDLSRNAVGPAGVRALMDGPLSLRVLGLADNDLRQEGVEVIAGAERSTSLRQLDLSHNAIGPHGAAALSMSQHLEGLHTLDLTHNDVGSSGVAALAMAPRVNQLRTLWLGQNDIGPQGLQFLVASRGFGNLEELDLSSNGIGVAGLMGLSTSAFGRRLKRLELADNGLGNTGLAALLGAPQLSGLHALGLAQNEITAAGVALLVGASLRLESLDISRNPLGGVDGLSDALGRLPLSSLSIGGCALRGDQIAALLPSMPRLRRLDVSGNPLGRDGAAALGKSPELARVAELDLTQTELDAQALGALLAGGNTRELERLALDSNRLGHEGVAQLSRAATRLSRLQALTLSDTQLSLEGVGVLVSSPLTGHLHEVDLSHNSLADEGAQRLADAPSWQSLRKLTLQNNGISMSGALALLASPALSMVSQLDLQHNALISAVDAFTLRQAQIAAMESSFGLVSARGAEMTELFYERLFARYPSVKPLFAHVNMRAQRTHLLTSLVMIVDHLRDPEALEPKLRELGVRHVKYGVRPTQYYAVGETLLGVIRTIAGESWTDELEAAWSEGLDAVINTMMAAALVTADTRRAGPGGKASASAPTEQQS